MAKYIFREDADQIVNLNNLKVIDLNETSALIFKLAEKGMNQSNIAEFICKKYRLDYDLVFRDIAEFLQNLAKFNIYPDQKNKEKEWQINTPIIHILERCNSLCVFCDCWKTKSLVEHPVGLLEKFFIKIKKLGAKKVMISGGEPLLHKKLRDIILSIQKLGLKVMLNTNGLLLHKNTWLYQLEIDEIVISMDSTNRYSYQELRGIDAFDRVWHSLKEYKKNSSNTVVGIRSIVSKENYLKIDEMIQQLQCNNGDFLGLSPLDISSTSFSRGNINYRESLKLANMLLPTVEEILLFEKNFKKGTSYYDSMERSFNAGLIGWDPLKLSQCIDYYKKLWLKKSISGPWTCSFPIFSMVLDYNGDFKNCFYSKPFGNLYNPCDDEFNGSFKSTLKQLRMSNKCATCRGKIFCD